MFLKKKNINWVQINLRNRTLVINNFFLFNCIFNCNTFCIFFNSSDFNELKIFFFFLKNLGNYVNFLKISKQVRIKNKDNFTLIENNTFLLYTFNFSIFQFLIDFITRNYCSLNLTYLKERNKLILIDSKYKLESLCTNYLNTFWRRDFLINIVNLIFLNYQNFEILFVKFKQ